MKLLCVILTITLLALSTQGLDLATGSQHWRVLRDNGGTNGLTVSSGSSKLDIDVKTSTNGIWLIYTKDNVDLVKDKVYKLAFDLKQEGNGPKIVDILFDPLKSSFSLGANSVGDAKRYGTAPTRFREGNVDANFPSNKWVNRDGKFDSWQKSSNAYIAFKLIFDKKNSKKSTFSFRSLKFTTSKFNRNINFGSSPSKWAYSNGWSFTEDTGLKNVNSNLEFSMQAWTREFMWLHATRDLILDKGYKYELTFELKENASNQVSGGSVEGRTVHSLKVDFMKSYSSTPSWELNRDYGDYPDNLIFEAAGSDVLDKTVTQGYKQFTFKFTADQNYPDARLLLRLQLNDRPSRQNKYLFRNIKLKGGAVHEPELPTLPKGGFIGEVAKIPVEIAPVRSGGDCPWNRNDLEDWSDLGLSTNGGSVTLPNGKSVIVSNFGNEVFEKITIPAGTELIFAHKNIKLKVRNIRVQGRLWIGAPDCTFNKQATITFFGDKSNDDDIANGLGKKGLGVDGNGRLDIHGKQYRPTWSRLAITAFKGDKKIQLQQEVNWKAGQKVVVSTTVYGDPEDDPANDQNEIMVIKSVDGSIVTFTKALKFMHYGGSEYQAEVGLLSRNVLLQGNTGSDSNKFGGHVIIRGKNARARVSGAEFVRMGQQNMLARYPIHFHLAQNQPNSYVMENSIHDSYFRCVVVHGTHKATVSYNVAYNADGSCYYLEDGVEENNQIKYNLGVKINTIGGAARDYNGQNGQTVDTRPEALQPADASASVFYFTNAYNTIVGNAAVGGWAGMGFINLPEPIGDHAGIDMVPMERPTKKFDGNTARASSHYFAFSGCVYTGGYLTMLSSPRDLRWKPGRESRNTKSADGSENDFMKFTNLKVSLCRNGEVHWGQRLDISNYEIHDVKQGGQLFGRGSIINGLFVGHTKNKNTIGSAVGFEWYDTGTLTILSNIEFRNYFVKTDDACFQSLVHSDRFTPDGISATKKIKYTNCDKQARINHRIRDSTSSTSFNVYDTDGSQTGRSGAQVIGAHDAWWNDGPGCRKENAWDVWTCNFKKNTDLPRYVASISIYDNGFPKDTEDQTTVTPVGWAAQFGYPNRKIQTTAWIESGVIGYANKGWYLYFTDGTPADFKIRPFKLPESTWVVIAVSYPGGSSFTVSSGRRVGGNLVWTARPTANNLNSLTVDNYYWDGTYLYVRLEAPRPHDEYKRAGVTLHQPCYWDCHDVWIQANCGGAYCDGTTNVPPAL